MSALSDLLAALREEALSGIWANGVKLARAGAVSLESQEANELVFRVRAPGRPVPWTSVLHPADGDWECDCPGKVDPCEHVVAAAIAAQQGESQGAPLQATEATYSRVGYRFSRADNGLALARSIVAADGSQTPLEGTLAGLLADSSKSKQLQVEQHDLVADRLLERPTRGPLRPEQLARILETLAPAKRVFLDGQPIAINEEPVYPRAIVEERGPDLALTLARDPRVTEVLAAGAALCGDVLARLGETELTGDWLQNLPSTRVFKQAQIGELSAQVLPELAKRLDVEVRTPKVPPVDRKLKPRVVLELSQVGAQLSVLPLLVYGAPPHARIDEGKLVYLRGAVPLRDTTAEARLIHQLRDELNMAPGRRVFATGQDMVQLVEKVRHWRGGLAGEASKILSPNVKLVPDLQIQSDPNGSVGFGMRFQVVGGEGEVKSVDAASVISAWRDGLGLVPLEGGGWAPLPQAFLDANGQRVADLLAARAETGQLANAALPQLAELCDALEHPRPPGLEKLAPLLEGFERLPEPSLPADLQATLRPYQRRGVSWLQFLKQAGVGGVLADDMGLGKTLQAICALGTKTLVVCPTSVLPNWADELKRFRPSMKVSRYHGAGRALDPSADVTITTYALLRLEADALTAVKWDAVVLDEAQAIKNPDSQVARAAYKLQAAFKVALSGTPLENKLDELWSVMHFANPGLLGGRSDFESQIARPMAEGDKNASQRLRKKIRPFVLRRLKQDVAPDLPPRTESVLSVELDEKERAVYDAVYTATRADVVKLLTGVGNVLAALEALLRLRQAACHAALVPGQHARSSSKVKALLEALTTAVDERHKALVFSQWTSLLDLIEPELKNAGIDFCRLDGSTVDRGGVTARFQANDGPPVMLLSLKAGGTGLNLTAADHVFLVDPWWNPAVEAQAADRAHRIGQENPVFVYRLVSQGTVEERILNLQEKKRALFEAALGEAGAAAGLTREDLLQLFD
ncbi:MAG: DEAD/DEAH box helicase [Deltaproteobacteria bacterium]|nr:DEAD/DEAH box helicase [Deltaproteobacteria bacterium]